jgi:peptide/nickel transport system permease protein
MTVNFFLPRWMPGNPAEAIMMRVHGHINPAALQALEVAFGINTHDNVVVQYFQYLGNVAQGQFGISTYFFPASVSHMIGLALPWTLGLVGLTTILAFVLGTLIGMLAAWRRGGITDSLLPPLFVVLSALPFFWLGLVFIWFFSVQLGWFPSSAGYDTGATIQLTWPFLGQLLAHGFLPALTLLLVSVGGWILTMRNNMITVLAEDYIRMARAKGLSPTRIMLTYAGRNAILPNLVGFAMSLGFVVSGAILIEIVFTYPGLGYMLYQAVTGEDYPLMQTIFLIITVAVLLAVLAADAATALLDPRTRERR